MCCLPVDQEHATCQLSHLYTIIVREDVKCAMSLLNEKIAYICRCLCWDFPGYNNLSAFAILILKDCILILKDCLYPLGVIKWAYQYAHKPLRKIKNDHMQSPAAGWQPTLCVAWYLIWWFARVEKHGHTWHRMSLLRPGVSKLTQTQRLPLTHQINYSRPSYVKYT